MKPVFVSVSDTIHSIYLFLCSTTTKKSTTYYANNNKIWYKFGIYCELFVVFVCKHYCCMQSISWSLFLFDKLGLFARLAPKHTRTQTTQIASNAMSLWCGFGFQFIIFLHSSFIQFMFVCFAYFGILFLFVPLYFPNDWWNKLVGHISIFMLCVHCWHLIGFWQMFSMYLCHFLNGNEHKYRTGTRISIMSLLAPRPLAECG